MSLTRVCRLCLAINSPIYVLTDGPLQVIYEKLTNITLKTPRRPVGACFLCYSQLRKCHNLMVRSVRADKLLSQILHHGEVVSEESIATINRQAYQLNNLLTFAPTELVTFPSSDHDLQEDQPAQPYCNNETEKDMPIPIEDIKCEDSEAEWIDRAGVEDEEDSDSVVLIDVHDANSEIKEEIDIDDEIWTDDKAILEDVNEFIDDDHTKCDDLDGLKNIKIECMMPKVLEGIEDMGSNEFRDDVSTMKWRQTYTKAQDELVKQDIPEDQWKHTSNMLRSNNKTTKLLQKSPKISTITLRYPKTVIKTGHQNIKTDAHIHNTVSKDLEEKFICYNCGSIFNDKCGLIEHMDYHQGERSQKCTMIENQRINKEKLRNKHTKTRTEKYHLEYDIRERSFIKTINSAYLKTHTKEKPFACSVCQRTFTTKCSLKTHFMRHAGEMPYECEKCPRRFIQKSHLDYHLQNHTGEKRYKCPICQRNFTQTGNLKTHLRTHTGETPFQCTLCQRSFTQKIQLDNHLKTHTGERPFQCTICRQGFIQKRHLMNHLKKHEKDQQYFIEK